MPRKSTASAAATDTNGDVSMVSEAPAASLPKQSTDQAQSDKQEKQGKRKSEGDVVALDDLSLPKSIIQRISKGVLPANTSISKDAILALTKSATVFISHLAGEANDMTDRKTIQSQDVIKALKEIEMENVMGLGILGKDGRRGGRVEREVEKWEGDIRGKRRGYREKVKARESGAGDTTVGTVDTEDGDGDGEERDHENEVKRVRIDDEAREESAGPITAGTSQLKLNAGRRKSDEVEDADGEEAGDDVEEDESEQEGENGDEDEQDETQGAEDSIDVEDADSRRKNGTLAPDGRVEVGGSDDDSE